MGQKNPRGELISWAAPICGFRSEGKWAQPILEYWSRVKPQRGNRYRYLFPYFNSSWVPGYNRRGSHGVTQSALTRLETLLGSPKLLKLYSARTWFPTCARQLEFGLEDRTALGHWQPGIKMPNNCDRAECATELSSSMQILSKIEMGWEPAGAFDVPDTQPNTPANTQAEGPASSAGSTSSTSSLSTVRSKRQDISKLDED